MPTAQVADIFDSLKQQIVHYDLKPRERLTESGLASRYGSSRTPIREALRKLEQEGWILLVPHQGYYVRDFSLRELEDVYELRIGIERFGAGLAARRMNPEQYEPLHAFWSQPPRARDPDSLPGRDGDRPSELSLLRADEEFHEAIAAASGNAELLRHVCSLNERIRIIRRIAFGRPGEVDRMYEQHLQVLEAIHAGRVAEAEQGMEAHISQSRTTIIDLAQEGLARVYLKS
jgi:DNA-binding GntR family transcriptional regulator